jgi:hypothetical protein
MNKGARKNQVTLNSKSLLSEPTLAVYEGILNLTSSQQPMSSFVDPFGITFQGVGVEGLLVVQLNLWGGTLRRLSRLPCE